MTDARLDRIADLLTLKAHGQYGLADLTQRQHALQCAWLAEQQGCPEALIVASLLHDVGHLVHDLGADPGGARGGRSARGAGLPLPDRLVRAGGQ